MNVWTTRGAASSKALIYAQRFAGSRLLHGSRSTRGEDFFSNSNMNSSSTRNAYRILGLSVDMVYTSKHIRDAYYKAAKRCHPDVPREEEEISRSAHEFIRLTDAYELLRRNYTVFSEDVLQEDDEEQFRRACKEWLGLSAEIVEESKRCPMFRKWLTTGSQGAEHWLNFLCMNGGLAPRLRSPTKLAEGFVDPKHTATSTNNVRRRRR